MNVATIFLQRNPKAKMMCLVFALLILTSIEAPITGDDNRIVKMIRAFAPIKTHALLLAATFAIAAPAFAQAPSQAQRDAVKSKCRSDYIAHCSSIPPGGEASLECLQKNMSSLSASCQTAVRAIGAPAAATAPPATAAPAKSAAKPAPKAAASTSGATAAAATPAAPAAPAAGAAPAAAPAVIVLRPLRPREELFVLRSACGADVRTVCGGVAPGGGRIVQCLATNAGALSPACRDVLAPFAAAR